MFQHPYSIVFLANPDSWYLASRSGIESSDPQFPYAVPTLWITTAFHAASACYEYLQYMQTGQMCFALGLIGSGCLAATGLWCKLFASSEGRISRRTGADKRTSGFPFSNAEANKKKLGKKKL